MDAELAAAVRAKDINSTITAVITTLAQDATEAANASTATVAEDKDEDTIEFVFAFPVKNQKYFFYFYPHPSLKQSEHPCLSRM